MRGNPGDRRMTLEVTAVIQARANGVLDKGIAGEGGGSSEL